MVKRTEERVLACFRENPDSSLTISQLARRLATSYPNVYLTCQALHKRGLLSIRKTGNSSSCSLNLKSDEVILFLSWLDAVHTRERHSQSPISALEKNRQFLERSLNIRCCFLLGNRVIGLMGRLDSTEIASQLQKVVPGCNAVVVDAAGLHKLLEANDIAKRIIVWGFEEFHRFLLDAGGETLA